MSNENPEQHQEGEFAALAGSPSLGAPPPSVETEDGPGGGVGAVPVECPQCYHGFYVSPTFCVPKEQVIYLEMGGTSEFFSAELIGQQILNMEKLLRCIAKDAGAKCVVFMKSIELEPNKVKLGFLVVDDGVQVEFPRT
jgi:hypothetical protein